MLAFLRVVRGGVLTKAESQLVEKVVSECSLCRAVEPRLRRVLAVPAEVGWLERGWCDLFHIRRLPNGVDLWALGVADECTGDVAFCLLNEGTSGALVWEAYYDRWASIRGHFVHLLSDAGGELVSRAFLEHAEEMGVFKTVTAAKSSESHGKIERYFRTARWTLDRLAVNPSSSKWGVREWKRALQDTENAIRNEVLAGGSSASLRSMGRTSTVHRNLSATTLKWDRQPHSPIAVLP